MAPQGPTLRAQLSVDAVLVDVVFDASACPGASLLAEPVTELQAPGLSRLVLTSANASCVALRAVLGRAPVPDAAPAGLAALDAWAVTGPWSAGP